VHGSEIVTSFPSQKDGVMTQFWSAHVKTPLKAVLPHRVRKYLRTLVPASPPVPASASAPASAPAVYPFHKLVPGKLEAIDYAATRFGFDSFADLGGVWNVDGGYSFYALEKRGVRKGVLVDYTLTPAVAAWGRRYPGFTTITGGFGTQAVARQIGHVDAIFLFDVLLHQVNPDWDQVLDLYASRTSTFVILNQQFVAKKTFRLLDRGPEEYLRHVPHSPEDTPVYRCAVQTPDAIHPSGCKYRDVTSIWQWGITDDDLIAKMKSIGFSLQYFKNCSTWKMTHVEDHAFVFRKTPVPKY
jgi:hypothetical protein